MSARSQQLRTLLDAGVPDSAGHLLRKCGHTVILHREVLLDRTTDDVVCATALANEAILVAIDADMKSKAKRYGAVQAGQRFERLNLIRLCCNEVLAAKRLEQSMSLIEHEWRFSQAKVARRLWVEIGAHFIRTNR